MTRSRFEAEPYPLEFDPGSAGLIIIDMQRDFLEPGGFGEFLGNDVSLLRSIIEPCRRFLDVARAAGLTVIHTREGHQADLSDAPPTKLARGHSRHFQQRRLGVRVRVVRCRETIIRGFLMADTRMRWWVPGDWNGFFGLGTNVLVNLMVLTGLLKFVIQIPDALLFGRILPAIGLMLFLGNMYYAWMAKRLAEREGRGDVAALPSGPSVPHMFFVVFAIMLPIKATTGDPIKAYEAGLAWVFIEGTALAWISVIVVGLLWGATAAFMIDRKHNAAAIVALTAAVLTLFGFIHGPAVDWFVSPKVAPAYLIVAALLSGFARMESEPAQAG